MPLPIKIKQPVGNPQSSPFQFRVDVTFEPPISAPDSTRAKVVASWSPAHLDYVPSSIQPCGTVDEAAGTATWSSEVIQEGAASQFSVELGCKVAGSGTHTLSGEATDLVNGGPANTTGAGIICPS